jgi:hypothetical protein
MAFAAWFLTLPVPPASARDRATPPQPAPLGAEAAFRRGRPEHSGRRSQVSLVVVGGVQRRCRWRRQPGALTVTHALNRHRHKNVNVLGVTSAIAQIRSEGRQALGPHHVAIIGPANVLRVPLPASRTRSCRPGLSRFAQQSRWSAP